MNQRARILLAFPLACAALTIGVLVYLGKRSPDPFGVFDLALLGFNLLGPLGLVVLIRLGKRYWAKGTLVVLAACAVFTATHFYALITLLQDDDANGVLLLLFLPIYQVGLLILLAGLTALTHWLRSRASWRGVRSIEGDDHLPTPRSR